MLLESEIKVGEIYVFNPHHHLGLHQGTYTVKLLEINHDEICTVESQQTSELLTCGTHMLTTLERANKMYDAFCLIENQDYSIKKDMEILENVMFFCNLNKDKKLPTDQVK